MIEIYPFLWLIVAIISLMPAYIFWIGYLKLKTKDLLITAVAFSLFFVKAITLAMKVFIGGADDSSWYLDDEFWFAIAAVLDIIIIGLIASSFTNVFNPLGNGENGKDLMDGILKRPGSNGDPVSEEEQTTGAAPSTGAED